MYRALYNYEGQDQSSLSFAEKDLFTVMDTKNEYWWLVQNGKGHIGYIPANYLIKDEASQGAVLMSIDRAIAAINPEAKPHNSLTKEQQSNLVKLQNHRLKMMKEFGMPIVDESSVKPRREAPPAPPTRGDQIPEACPAAIGPGQSDKDIHIPSPPWERAKSEGSVDKKRRAKKSEAPPPPESHQEPQAQSPPSLGACSEVTATDTSDTNSRNDVQKGEEQLLTAGLVVPCGLGLELVDHVRSSTKLSYDLSQVAVAAVLTRLKASLPQLGPVCDGILQTIISPEKEMRDMDTSQDAVQLRRLFSDLAACKDDSQQRSWFLHEDEQTIMGHIEQLLGILVNADPQVCRRILAEDNYECLHHLVLYYQMEPRATIRLQLLQVFGALCGLEAKVISELLYSVLPLELARDMQADTKDIQKWAFSALVMTMLFSMGEPLPVHHYEQLSEGFADFLIETVESPPESDYQDQLPDVCLKLVLAFNLHFELPADNLVMRALAARGTAKHFSEKLMLLVNRGEDPVRLFDHEPAPPNTLLKFMSDLYSAPTTATLLYTNDAKVLIDIVLRQISDLSPGDKIRTDYLSLFHLILTNSDYDEHRHRHQDLRRCFIRIKGEEDADAQMDQRIVAQIFREFPDYFGN